MEIVRKYVEDQNSCTELDNEPSEQARKHGQNNSHGNLFSRTWEQDAPCINSSSRHATAMLMVADALHDNTSCYYVKQDDSVNGRAVSVWLNDAHGSLAARLLHGRMVGKLLSRLSTVMLLLAVFRSVFLERVALVALSTTVEVLALCLYWTEFLVSTRYLWHSRAQWLCTNAQEPKWKIVLGMVLVVDTMCAILGPFDAFMTRIDTISGVLHISPVLAIGDVMSAFYIVHYNHELRRAITVCVKVDD